jgi:hypothetical protein
MRISIPSHIESPFILMRFPTTPTLGDVLRWGIVTEISAQGAREPNPFTKFWRVIPEREAPWFRTLILIFAVVSSHAQ